MTDVRNADHDLLFLRLLAHCLMSRLENPQVFTEDEIRLIQKQYHGIRTFFDPNTGSLTIALKPVVDPSGPG